MTAVRQAIIGVFIGWLMLAMPTSAAAAQRGALFKVSAKGHTMYLFGTMHAGVPDFYPLEPTIRTAVEHASVLALELDPLADPSRMAAAMQKFGMYPNGATQAIPPRLQPRLDKALARAAMDPAMVAHVKPWLTAVGLTMVEYTSRGYRPELAVDLHLAQLARANKVPVVELESLSMQLGLFASMSQADQWQLLDDVVQGLEGGKEGEEVMEIINAWSTADKAAFEKIAQRAEQDTTTAGKFFQKVLLEDRNGPLADKLASLLEKQDKAVAAIGVMHLVGRANIPDKLRKRGIKVERIY